MQLEEFVREFDERAENLAWFFGAGSSIEAGIPGAYDLVWDFKWKVYKAEAKPSKYELQSLNEGELRNQIQKYFDKKDNFPKLDSIDEYSFYFKLAYPKQIDRRIYIENLCKEIKIKPNSGHKVIGQLMKEGKVKLVFTTNFDTAFEDQAHAAFKNGTKYFVASLNYQKVIIEKYQSNARPFITKIHGDFLEENLKNTEDELKLQDNRLRKILLNACHYNGLCIMGYSGRDESVMSIFEDALNEENAYSKGIYWFKKKNTSLLPSVDRFLQKANEKNIITEVVEIDSFNNAWNTIGDYISKRRKPLTRVTPNKPTGFNKNEDVNFEKPGNLEGSNTEPIQDTSAHNLNDRIIEYNTVNEINNEPQILFEETGVSPDLLFEATLKTWRDLINSEGYNEVLSELLKLSEDKLSNIENNRLIILLSLYELSTLKTNNRSINSPFQDLAKQRAALYINTLLLKDISSDFQCTWLIQKVMNYMPLDGLADRLKIIHKNAGSNLETRIYWASLFHWCFGPLDLPKTEKCLEIDGYEIGKQNPENEDSFQKLLANFDSDIIIHRIHAAFQIGAWAINLKMEPNIIKSNYDIILNRLSRMLLNSTNGEKFAATYAIIWLLRGPKGYFDGNRINLETQQALIEALQDKTNDPIVIESISRTLGVLFQTSF